MIPEYPVPEYYLTDLDLDFEPRIGETVTGAVTLEFEIDNPEISSNPAGLMCESEFSFDLYVEGEAPWETDEEGDTPSPIGEVRAEADIFLPGPPDRYEDHYETWESETYESLDTDFIYHIESGILQHVVNPIGDLLSNSYSGIVPRMRFSGPLGDEADRD
jgi:hypothetical protein